ncbi:hypothetical protein SAY86_009622 [Trapa natans]|uniref:Uncharacterized protein n=1 Tax=Trapa natans TaxID=22666 RepID=A0AAN7KWB3_TRANT|nr:hypothetical protein SAY86_009622 [Trapa natans]
MGREEDSLVPRPSSLVFSILQISISLVIRDSNRRKKVDGVMSVFHVEKLAETDKRELKYHPTEGCMETSGREGSRQLFSTSCGRFLGSSPLCEIHCRGIHWRMHN